MNALRKLAPETNSAPRLKQQKYNLKQQWIQNLINSKLKSKLIIQQHSNPSTWNYQLLIQTNLLIPMTNLLMISSDSHSSSQLKIFTCITIYNTPIFHDPRRQHTYSYFKWWYSIPSAFFQLLSKNKSCPLYKSLVS